MAYEPTLKAQQACLHAIGSYLLGFVPGKEREGNIVHWLMITGPGPKLAWDKYRLCDMQLRNHKADYRISKAKVTCMACLVEFCKVSNMGYV